MEFYALVPENGIAGGIECQVQLVDALRSLNEKAYLSYYPQHLDDKTETTYKEYGYNVSSKALKDDKNHIVIIPEIQTFLATKYKKSKKVINWLSIDNYYQRKHKSSVRDFYMKYKTLYRSRLPIKDLRHYYHLAQSHYALKYLEKNYIRPIYTGDYIGQRFINESKSFNTELKKNIIAYNPQKGLWFTKLLIRNNPSFKFIPLINMSRVELIKVLAKAKIYIDFGHHPGRDRIPREARILNCCLITSNSGSASNNFDIEILDKYKFSLENKSISLVSNLIKEIFTNYEDHILFQKPYYERILSDKKTFLKNIKSFISLVKTNV